MRILFLILWSVLTSFCKAKTPESLIQLRLKFHPLPLLNPDKPYLQGSAELLIKKKWGAEVGFGKRYLDDWVLDGVLNDKKPDSAVVKFKGSSFFIDVKYYGLALQDRRIIDYLGFVYRRTSDLRNVTLQYYPNNSGGVLSNLDEEHCAVQRELKIFALKYGWVYTYKRLNLEWFAEIGIKQKKQFYIANESYEAGKRLYSYFHNPSPKPVNNNSVPHVSVGIRIGYTLNFKSK